MTLSTPIKVVALAGVALILGLGGVLLLAGRHSPSHTATPPSTPVPATPTVVKVTAPPVHHVVKPAKPKVQLADGLPTALHRKLELSRKVVAFVYTGASASDRALLVQARAGAHDAHVPFVALNVTDEHTAEAVYKWAATSSDPAFLVVKRPGQVVFQLNGLLDRATAAQAATSAK